jgi:uridine kinase
VSDEIQVVHLDDFYRPSTERYVGAISERPIGADFDLARLCSEVLVPLRSGLPAAYRIYDWPTDRLSPTTVSVIQPIVIIEGVYSFSRALAGFFDFSIWVECPLELRLARGLARDGEAARARWVEDWMPGEDKYIAKERPRGRAALVCDGSRTDYKESVVVLQTMQRMR